MKASVFATIFAFTLVSLFDSVVSEELVARTSDTFSSCAKYCTFPPHSVAKCDFFHPCGFTCTDGYVPFPAWSPTKCVCNWPYTECNGKCGTFKACSSKGHYRRDLSPSEAICPKGFTACGILGRHTGSWECIDTAKDLESCGGCMVSVKNDVDHREGQDCTAITGVADVSCVRGGCIVNKCMPGYEIAPSGTTCDIAEPRKKTILSVAEDILAAEYGLEHVPL